MTHSAEFEHFIRAQDPIYAQVLRELAAGRKRTHWMWFVFPQLRGLGHSTTAERFALDSLPQAERYAEHPVLGPRLVECTRLVLAIAHPDPEVVFGCPDWMKFRSSMTLFSLCKNASPVFADAIDRCFSGLGDERTRQLLEAVSRMRHGTSP